MKTGVLDLTRRWGRRLHLIAESPRGKAQARGRSATLSRCRAPARSSSARCTSNDALLAGWTGDAIEVSCCGPGCEGIARWAGPTGGWTAP